VTGEAATVWRRALRFGAACVTALIAVYLLAVWTAPGQRFEDGVLRAADRVAGSSEEVRALDTLASVSVPAVLLATVAVVGIGFARRRPFLGLVAAGAMAAAIVTTEVIQRIGHRPILLDSGYRREDQSFPSGHTTVAMAVMCGLVLVIPYRFRGLAVLGAVLYAASVGVATVTASWHRPSDTIGAGLIVVAYACVAVAVLARSGRLRAGSPGTVAQRAAQRGLTAAAAGVAILALVLAAVAARRALSAADDGIAYAAVLRSGRLLALSGSAAVAACLLALLRRTDLGARPDRAGERSRDVASGHAGVDRPAGP
jgi:membrane-associated phospholipid phosphatase